MTTETKANVLSPTNEFGYYEIRMESIGGQGANLAGKILAEAAIIDIGLNGISFASYGSEKKGTPVKAYIRLAESDEEIRVNSPVIEPHLLVVFSTVLEKSVPLMMGVKPGTKIIVNTSESPEEIRELLKVPGGTTIICVDALKIAVEEKVRINTVILGAIARGVDFIEQERLEHGIRRTFEKKYPKLVDPNIKGFRRGHDEVKVYEVPDDSKYPQVEWKPFQPKLGWKNAPIGGTIVNPGNSVLNDLSASRSGFKPVWHEELCIHCGECDAACPDQCIFFTRREDGKGKERQFFDHIDYQYCKGCLRCVSACPKEALTAERETAE
ncbi:MAG TPA: 2-oxoacid:acceptor oxidoreductase family protein [bacterium]|nr:2-oxoacid:acceptor oxidoreductase family protein [bacterium]